MKNNLPVLLSTVLILFVSVTDAVSQIQFGKNESFGFLIDTSHSDNYEFLTSASLEYKGAIYARFGFDFATVDKGYFGIQFAAGARTTVGWEEKISIYAGGKGSIVSRNGSNNPVGGIEGGIDYTFNIGLLIGVNISHLYHSDFKAVYLPEIWETHFGLRLGYIWDI